jgi:hypothetical protein
VQASEPGKRFARSCRARWRQQPGEGVEVGVGGGGGGAVGTKVRLSEGLLLVAVVRTGAAVRDDEVEDGTEDSDHNDGEDGESQAVDSLNWSTASKPVSSRMRVVSGARKPVKSPKSKPLLSSLGAFFGPSPRAGLKS